MVPFPAGFDTNLQGLEGLCRPGAAFGHKDEVLIQGGTLDLSGLSISLGFRYAF